MNEFIEKLIGRLEEYKYSHLIERNSEQCEHCKDVENCENRDCSLCIWDKSISIVNQLAEEYKGGWIPCEVELPKIPNSYLVTKMCENDGNPIYDVAHEIFWTKDEKWDCERDEDCEWKVIAWQNKLAPYQPKGE